MRLKDLLEALLISVHRSSDHLTLPLEGCGAYPRGHCSQPTIVVSKANEVVARWYPMQELVQSGPYCSPLFGRSRGPCRYKLVGGYNVQCSIVKMNTDVQEPSINDSCKTKLFRFSQASRDHCQYATAPVIRCG